MHLLHSHIGFNSLIESIITFAVYTYFKITRFHTQYVDK